MLGLHIKKSFFDWIDNFSFVILSNLLYVLTAVLTALVILAVGSISYAGTLLLIAVVIMIIDFISLGVSRASYIWVRGGKAKFSDFKEAWGKHFKHFLLKSLVDFASLTAVIVGIPYYLTVMSIVGYGSAVICFWIGIISFLTMQFYYPLCMVMEGDSAVKTFKKALVIMWDNMGYALYMALRALIELALTVFTAGFVPGFAGINIARANMVKFLMLRYDYMDEKKLDKKYVFWEKVLEEERKSCVRCRKED